MTHLRTRLLTAAFIAALSIVPASSAFARGGFSGGGFRSAPALRSFGSPRSFGSARGLTPWGSANRPTLKAAPSTPRLGGILGGRASVSRQRGLYDSARRGGTLFTSKAEAAQAFKSRYAKDYSSVFASEPASRPSYIPSSALVGGRSVNIVYNPSLGGYGYLHPILGTWMLYNALADAASLDLLMSRNNYYWGGSPVYLSHGPRFHSLAFAVLILFLIAAIVVRASARRRVWR